MRCGFTARRILCALSSSCSSTVAAAVFLALALRRDRFTALLTAGALANAALGKVLKRLFRSARPDGGVSPRTKTTSGMPSSHANSLFFLVTYVACAGRWGRAWLLAGTLYAVAVCGTRVVLQRLHTVAQAVAGAAVGSACAAAWTLLWPPP